LLDGRVSVTDWSVTDLRPLLADHTLVTFELLSWWLNGARQGLGCYWSLIESRWLAFKWHINRWPWMTLKGH